MPVLRSDDSFWESERTWCTLWPGGAGKAENPKVLPSGGQPPDHWRNIRAGGGDFTSKGGCPRVPIHSDFIAGLQRKPLAITSWDQSRRSKQSVVTPGFCQINWGLELTSPWHWQFRLTPRASPLWAVFSPVRWWGQFLPHKTDVRIRIWESVLRTEHRGWQVLRPVFTNC